MTTILGLSCYIVDMTTKDTIYDIPNIGCLLGVAYQAEEARLSKALNEARLGITAAEYVIIRLLLANGEMQQCEIARILNKDRASISRSIKYLEKKGIVSVNQISYKCCRVALSEAGNALKPNILGIAETLNKNLASRLSAQQMKNLREILTQIIN